MNAKKWFSAVLLSLCLFFASGMTPIEAKVDIGAFPNQQAPQFSLQTLEGKSVSLDDFKGKPVVLNLFASWCPPCQEEMPLLNELSKTIADKGMIIGINLTNQEHSLEDVKAFVKQFNVPFPVVLDEKGEVAKLYQLIGIPTTLVIDANGIVQKRYNGMLTGKMIEEMAQLIN